MIAIRRLLLSTLLSATCFVVSPLSAQNAPTVKPAESAAVPSSFTQHRNLKAFDSVRIQGNFDIQIEMADQYSIQLESKEDVLSHVVTRVSKSGLSVMTKKGAKVNTSEPIKVVLKVKDLEKIKIHGANKVQFPNLEGKKFEMELSGHTEGLGNVNAEELKVRMNGTGNLIVTGTVKKLELATQGKISIQGLDLELHEAKINCKGSTKALLKASNTIKGTVQGVSELSYVGSPNVKVNVQGTAQVSQHNS